MSNQRKTRKLTAKEASEIVKSANEKYFAYETSLPDRIEAWCIANFNPEMEYQAKNAFEDILRAAISGKGNQFCLKTANMIINRHDKIRNKNIAGVIE